MTSIHYVAQLSVRLYREGEYTFLLAEGYKVLACVISSRIEGRSVLFWSDREGEHT